MKTKPVRIAICTERDEPEGSVSNNFARCEHYAVYDHSRLEFTFHNNHAKKELSDIGRKAAEELHKLDVDVVLVPEIGPKAFTTLKNMEIEVYLYTNRLSVRDILYQFYEGKLGKITNHTKQ